jgi:hypothetical protein
MPPLTRQSERGFPLEHASREWVAGQKALNPGSEEGLGENLRQWPAELHHSDV